MDLKSKLEFLHKNLVDDYSDKNIKAINNFLENEYYPLEKSEIYSQQWIQENKNNYILITPIESNIIYKISSLYKCYNIYLNT